MTLRQQIIEDRIEDLAKSLGVDKDLGFLRLSHHLITGESLYAFDVADLTEGGQDKQIDTITLNETSSGADIFILQVKNTKSFSSNALIQLHNGLNWLFNKPRTDLKTLANTSFRDKIHEYRSLQSNLGPSNLRIMVRFITNGHSTEISDEFKQELKAICDEFDNGTFEYFSCEPVGADELVKLMHVQEKKERRIDAEIRIRYDANSPSLIKYHSEGLKGLVCTVPATEIARLVNDDEEGAIFDLNIRRFLGTRGSVNKDIRQTCEDTKESYLFWFLNNGITIVCDHVDPVTDPDNAHVKVRNMQIVNGCQTATTIALAQNEGVLAKDTRVVVRIYETTDATLVDRIVLTTNNQNKITNRDLRANDQVQVDLEKAFAIYDYFYERKPRQFADTRVDAARIVPNELVAQAFLAVVLKKPSDARGRKYKVWGEFYNRIFTGDAVEPYIIGALIVIRVVHRLRVKGFVVDKDDVRRNLAKKGAFHVARMGAFLWRETEGWNTRQEELRDQLKALTSDPAVLDTHLDKAFRLLEDVVREGAQYSTDIDNALKSYTLDADIDRVLHKSTTTPFAT